MPKGTLYFDLLLLKVGRSAKVAKPAPLRLPKRLAVEDRVLLLKVVGVCGERDRPSAGYQAKPDPREINLCSQKTA